MAGNIAVVAAIVATLLGYLNLAKFVNQQLIGGSIVVLAATLLFKFVDDLSTWMLNADSKVGQTILLSTGLSVSRLEQAGVLLSAALRTVVVLLALLALVAPFGNIGAVVERFFSLFTSGFDVGGTKLEPVRIVLAVLVLLAGLAITQLVQRWLTDTYLPKTELDLGARNSVSTVARYVGIIIAVIWALSAMGLQLSKLALLVSALSVGIGFGLQVITQNFVSGLILLAERPVKIGDWVKLGDQEGDIRRISLRSTEIQVGDKSTLIVPNSELVTKTVRNMTMGNNQGRIQIQFAVPPSTDVGSLREALLEAYGAHTNVLKQPAPTVYIDSIGGARSPSTASPTWPARDRSMPPAAICTSACCRSWPSGTSRCRRRPISTSPATRSAGRWPANSAATVCWGQIRLPPENGSDPTSIRQIAERCRGRVGPERAGQRPALPRVQGAALPGTLTPWSAARGHQGERIHRQLLGMVQPRADFQIIHFVVQPEGDVDLAVGIRLHPLLGQHHLALRGHRFDPEATIRARARHQLQHVLAGAGAAPLLVIMCAWRTLGRGPGMHPAVHPPRCHRAGRRRGRA